MKNILIPLILLSLPIKADVTNTPINRTDIADITVVSEKISEDKWRVTFANHSFSSDRCASVDWDLQSFYWHPICSVGKTSYVDRYKGYEQNEYWKTDQICSKGLRSVPPNTVSVLGYLKKLSPSSESVKPEARIKLISVINCD